jgi:peptidoglycan/xylan/chitin deacetylase (PgdA/CDA1 family)
MEQVRCMSYRATIQRAARRTLKEAAAAYDRLAPPGRGIVVLAYHRVGRRTRVSVDLPEWLFEEQMVRLSEGGGSVGLDEGLRLLAEPPDHTVALPRDGAGPARGSDPVVVTFDDGTADFVDLTVPILVRHGIPATLYLATSFVEEGRPFPDDGCPASWAGLRDALSTGLIEIGSHSHGHLLFDRVSASTAAEDLDRSIGLIGDRLGVEARHFAYPKALPASGIVERGVRTRFASAAVAGTAPNRFGATDPYRLSRSPVQVHDGLRFFELKAKGGLRLEDSARRLASRSRYAGATT